MNCVQKSISPCIETLKVIDAHVMHLTWHQARFDTTRKELFGDSSCKILSKYLDPPKNGTYRIRITYADEIMNVEYLPYISRTIERFSLVETRIDYAYKYANRDALNALIPSFADDVIFTCKNELMDTSIANIALLCNGVWLTPKHPLLKGTTRARLLASGFLKEAVLNKESHQNASKFAIMNALIGFKIIENRLIEGLER